MKNIARILIIKILLYGNLYANTDSKRYIFLQDSLNILNSSLPLPSYFPFPIYREEVIKEYKFYSFFQNYEANLQNYKEFYENFGEDDTALKTHELEKEIYMLQSQLKYLQEKKYNWLVNNARSGYYIGVGTFFSFLQANYGIVLNNVSAGGILKVGFLRYFNNNSGLRAEIFGLIGGIRRNGKIFGVQYYGTRFSVMQDIRIFSRNYLGFFAGIGLGSYLFGNAVSTGVNLHIGVNYTPIKHLRLEFERIFIPHITESSTQDSARTLEATYLFSCSWIF